jgi:hypothetical protein
MRLGREPFRNICDHINHNFTDEFLDEKAATEALSRYCDKHGIPYPYGKRGRKPNR